MTAGERDWETAGGGIRDALQYLVKELRLTLLVADGTPGEGQRGLEFCHWPMLRNGEDRFQIGFRDIHYTTCGVNS